MFGNLSTEGVIILAAIILFVIILNIALFRALKHSKPSGELELFIKASQSMKRPFKSEEDQLAELSARVAELNRTSRLTDKPKE